MPIDKFISQLVLLNLGMENYNNSTRRLEQGLSKLTVLVFLPLVVASLYSAYHIIPFYYDYYELVNQMDSLVKVSDLNTDQQIRKKLNDHIKRTNLPITVDDVKIERLGETMRLSVSYEEVFYVTWQGKDYDLHTFQFDARSEGQP